jgi:hypothetical protein
MPKVARSYIIIIIIPKKASNIRIISEGIVMELTVVFGYNCIISGILTENTLAFALFISNS